MSIVRTHLIHQEYRDSVQLMRAAASVSKEIDGIHIASVMMGTSKNKPLLDEVGLLTPEANLADANDIVISIRADSEAVADTAIKFIIDYLSQSVQTSHDSTLLYRSIRGALVGLPDANLAVISVPGEYAARDSHIALMNGLNVLLFSDNVSLNDEVRLKKEAHENGLLLMGPDCGTAMIKNVGLGFCNIVNPGSIGIIAASGTGTQEVMTLCHHLNLGVIHAIGTGSRDVTDAVGGITMIDGLHALERDSSINLIILVSKPPETNTMAKIVKEIENSTKPIIINFLGKTHGYCDSSGKSVTVDTLEEAAYTAANFVQTGKLIRSTIRFKNENEAAKYLKESISQLHPEQKYIRGLYAGGTFTFEATQIIRDLLSGTDSLNTNVHLNGTTVIENVKVSHGHTLIDMGADEFTLGKPHPMIDQTERTQRFLEEINDPETAVILLDFVLGYGSHPDPVLDMEDAFLQWKKKEKYIPIIAHVCGTPLDPQDYDSSLSRLAYHGIILMSTNAQAAKLAALIALRKNISEI
ncbi:MAG: acyl-CoA synthetase FdrA [Candidatus Hodarchaeales archaeon]